MTSTTSNAPAFEEAIAVTPLTSHTYSADLQDSWCIGTGMTFAFLRCEFSQKSYVSAMEEEDYKG